MIKRLNSFLIEAMKEQSINNAKLGTFVLIGTLCLILGLYYIGSKRNFFSSTIEVSANFNNVGGLMRGNNVRFNGINVGIVSRVYAISDTLIKVVFTVDEESASFITPNSIASIGTDGLLGSKLINIAPGDLLGNPIREGDVLKTLNPIQMDKALRTLSVTNDNLSEISDKLRIISEKFSADNSLWRLLTDTVIAENIRNVVVRFKLSTNNAAIISGDLSKIVHDIKLGKGTVGALLMDTLFSNKLSQTIINIQSISDSIAYITGDFKNISSKIKNGNGAIGTLLTDTSFVHNLNSSMENVKNGSANFNENMEALKHSWPFKKYFKQQKKLKEKK